MGHPHPGFVNCPECGSKMIRQAWRRQRFCSVKCRSAIGHRIKNYEVSESGCFVWKGLKDRDGYGLLSATVNGKREQRAHRVSWIHHRGGIPEGKIVCHRCDNPACINPSHLFLGTWLDNMRDKAKKQRCNTPKGENSGTAKLTSVEVVRIRELHAEGVTQRSIAAQFKVGFRAINKIVHRQRWAHV